ncbi:MAG: four helix bundle protein [Bacteroidia bacterium]
MAEEKVYDLEERTFLFANNIRVFVNKIDQSIWNKEDIKQLVRSSGSVAANYIEANKKLGEKDFLMKIKICKKECKESLLWLKLLDLSNKELEKRTNNFN